jgi:CHASE1-domain containing sensor protein
MAPIIRWTRWFAVALTFVLLFSSFGVTAAAGRSPLASQETRNAELERNYQLRKQQLRSVDEMLQRGERRAAEISQLIQRAKAEGKNTTALQQALADYRAKLISAQAAWRAAAAKLAAHVGFTDAGKVSNTDQAAATMRAAGAYLESSYLTLRGAEDALNRALAVRR